MSLQNYSGKSKNPFDDDEDEMASGRFSIYASGIQKVLRQNTIYITFV